MQGKGGVTTASRSGVRSDTRNGAVRKGAVRKGTSRRRASAVEADTIMKPTGTPSSRAAGVGSGSASNGTDGTPSTGGNRLPPGSGIADRHKMDLAGILLVLGAVLLSLALYGGSLGPVGLMLRRYLGMSIGVTRFALPVLLIIAAGYAFTGRIVRDLPWQASAAATAMVCVSGLADVAGGLPGVGGHSAVTLVRAGGWLGVGVGGLLAAGLGTVGTIIVLSALGIFAALVITGITLRQVVRFAVKGIRRGWAYIPTGRKATSENVPEEGMQGAGSSMFAGALDDGYPDGYPDGDLSKKSGEFMRDLSGYSDDYAAEDIATYDPTCDGGGLEAAGGLDSSDSAASAVGASDGGSAGVHSGDSSEAGCYGTGETDVPGDNGSQVSGGKGNDSGGSGTAARPGGGTRGQSKGVGGDGNPEGEYVQQQLFPGSGLGGWRLPPLQMLSRSRPMSVDRRDIENVGRALVGALASHGVDTRLAGFTVGPTVTRYELELGSGVKVARVTSLSRDIAYAMASPDVRIIAPIPGKSAIGIEVPNRDRELVTLGDILSSREAKSDAHPLNVALGRDIAGKAVMVNLSDMPHLLISGATGSGKSSCINALIASILARATPDQVRLILIDPKRVELGPYGGLPHLLTDVVVDPRKAANALGWTVDEMDRRYRLLAEVGARDIAGYNDLVAANSQAEGVMDAWDKDGENHLEAGDSSDVGLADIASSPGVAGNGGNGGNVGIQAGVNDASASERSSIYTGAVDVSPDRSGQASGGQGSGTYPAGGELCEPATACHRGDGDTVGAAKSLAERWAGDVETGNNETGAGSDLENTRDGGQSHVEHSVLPYIVVVVDELNDLMMVAPRDVEDSVCRIAQMARAVGVHLVLATQRPSVDVITGVIKANVPSRLAFAVSSLADSRVILDQPGAERLVGKGDMLILTASSSVPRRIQGAWVDSREVQSVVGYWKRQRQAQYVPGVEGAQTLSSREAASQDGDELFDTALDLVVNAQIGSTSMLQRKLKVGFARAGRLMDLLERRGVVGPSEGSKARAVLMTPEELSATRSRRSG
ncbi:MAG: DNA translocase FtsK [Acidimicrobiales bacterium]